MHPAPSNYPKSVVSCFKKNLSPGVGVAQLNARISRTEQSNKKKTAATSLASPSNRPESVASLTENYPPTAARGQCYPPLLSKCDLPYFSIVILVWDYKHQEQFVLRNSLILLFLLWPWIADPPSFSHCPVRKARWIPNWFSRQSYDQ
jgi:hypothetical protein